MKKKMYLLPVLLAAGWGLSLLSGAVSCSNPAHSRTAPAETARAASAFNLAVRDSCILLLRTGDLIVRTGNDMTSRMFRSFNQTDKTYSHAGLVVIEEGYPFVYHSIGGEDNPDERLRRDSASFFLSPSKNLGFGIVRYSLEPAVAERVRAELIRYYHAAPLFDMQFSLATDDKLYCSELIYKVLLKATGDPEFITTESVMGYRFVGIDNLFISPHANFVCELTYK